MQLYLYDFSEFGGFDVGPDGVFDASLLRLDSYWTESDRVPFLVYVEGEIAGFVLVNSYTCLDENSGGRSIAEFFIMRKYRRQGVGKAAAFQVFERFRGKWEVRQLKINGVGQRFWRRVIREYTRGRFRETLLDNDSWRGPVQSFDNGGR